MSKIKLQSSIQKIIENIPEIYQNTTLDQELKSKSLKFEFKNSFFNNHQEIEHVDFKYLFSNLKFQKNLRESDAYDDLMIVIKQKSKKFKNLRNDVFRFIQIYFEYIGKLEFHEESFLFLFHEFYNSMILKQNTYFCPLFRFELSPLTPPTNFGKIQLTLVNEFDFKTIKEHHVGEFVSTPGFLYRVNSILRLQLDENEENPDGIAEKLFDKFLFACHIFDAGNVSYGTIFKNYYYFDPNKPTIINQKSPMLQKLPSLKLKNTGKFKFFLSRFNRIDFDDHQVEFLLIAIKKFSSSMTKTETVDKIIDLFIVLEALFSSPGETSFKIAFRTALFNGINEKDYEKIVEFIQPLYLLRNDILHGKKLIHEDDISQLHEFEELLRNSILGFLKLYSFYEENSDEFSKNKTFKKYILSCLDQGLINRTYLEPITKYTKKKSI
jgi:hypothetical protein